MTGVQRNWSAPLFFAATLVAAGCVASLTHASRARTSAPADRLYWGAQIGSHFTGTDAPWSRRATARFESITRKRVSLLQFSSPWADCRRGRCEFFGFPRPAFDTVRKHGAIPVFGWASYAVPMLEMRRSYRLSAIAQGRYDGYVRQWARDAKRWGHPFFLRFNWEMNGDWFPWSEGVNGNRPGDFVRAWRHVHDVFAAVGARKVTWMWCPNADYAGSGTPIRELYPGDAYVDWTCIDGYNRGKPWKSFAAIYQSTYDLLRGLAPAKPIAVAEVASTEKGGSKAAWITRMFRDLPIRFPKVRALVWFEKYDSHMDWPIETSKSARAAFRRGIASRVYVANRFKSLEGGRIRPFSR